MLKTIQTENALRPAGHYSQGIIHNDVLYVSGQFSIHPDTGEKVFGTAAEEAAQILVNLEGILEAAGTSIDRVIKVVVYVADIGYWDEVNAVYSAAFGDHKPVRTVVPTNELHFGFKVEMDFIAAV